MLENREHKWKLKKNILVHIQIIVKFIVQGVELHTDLAILTIQYLQQFSPCCNTTNPTRTIHKITLFYLLYNFTQLVDSWGENFFTSSWQYHLVILKHLLSVKLHLVDWLVAPSDLRSLTHINTFSHIDFSHERLVQVSFCNLNIVYWLSAAYDEIMMIGCRGNHT